LNNFHKLLGWIHDRLKVTVYLIKFGTLNFYNSQTLEPLKTMLFDFHLNILFQLKENIKNRKLSELQLIQERI
jgi:hypothetical protein